MSDKRDNKFVDELLDASLARYAASEPRAGLEERLLEELRARPAAAPVWAWSWQAAAVGVAVLALVAGVFYFTRQPAPESAARVQETAPVAAPAPESGAGVAPIPEASPAARRAPVARVERAAAAPRREQFPSPAPLSDEERLLLRYTQQAPPEHELAARLGEGKLAELRIEPLRIPPLGSEPN